MIPVFGAMALKKELKGRTAVVVGGSVVAMFVAVFVQSFREKHSTTSSNQ